MSLRIPEFGPTTQWGTKTDRGMIWLILGFFLPGFCSLPYLNTSLVGSSTKGQAWYSFILEPWHVFNQVNPTAAMPSREPQEKVHNLHNLHCWCAPDVSEEDLWQKCAYSKITVTRLPLASTFALSAAIQSWIGENIPKFCKRRLGDEMQRRSVAVWWIVWADIVSDLFVITRN